MYLIHLGNIMSVIGHPPARVLDLGVGSGWTSVFLPLSGYEVVGVDIAESMIQFACQNRAAYGANGLQLVTSDYEDLAFEREFDVAVFYDSLHHAVDEEAALACAFRALRPGGRLICHEPGVGHSQVAASLRAVENYNVTENDKPPRRIIEVGRKVGFGSYQIYDHMVKPRQVAPV